MIPALVDTDTLSRFFRNDARVVERFESYTRIYGGINLSIITYYEIHSGLLHRDARKQLERFQAFAALNPILPLSREAADHAARLYAETRKQGTPVDDIDNSDCRYRVSAWQWSRSMLTILQSCQVWWLRIGQFPHDITSHPKNAPAA